MGRNMVNRAKRQSREDGQEYLRDRLVDVEQHFYEDLKRNQRAVTHDGALGDATEDHWIKLFRKYLPGRYSVAKAFAIDHKGKTTDQLDCLIYDAHYTPELFGKDNYLYIPAEAVYATFEIKQDVNATHLEYAATKADSLRSLERTSAPIHWMGPKAPTKKPFRIIAGLLAMEAEWKDGLEASACQQQFEK